MQLIAFPRIHVGLLDLGGATSRAFGGAGFSINGLTVDIQFSQHNQLEIVFDTTIDERCRSDIDNAIDRMLERNAELTGRYQVNSIPPQHVGLGSKTSLLLGLLTAINIHNKFHLKVEELQLICGRGGASGIGINTFFSGGFIVDAGHPADEIAQYRPSSAAKCSDIPFVTCNFPIPESWDIHLLMRDDQRVSGDKEKRFFRENTPISKSSVREAIALLYHGIVPAFGLGDLGLLSKSLRVFHQTGFKKVEVNALSEESRTLFFELSGHTHYACGVSSLGPLIYVVSNRAGSEIESHLKEKCLRHGASYLGCFCGKNSGYEVTQ